ncbi:MAG: TetR/AcrR family transcriptional regulator [Clostridiales bacterium]|jgi:AcrR family transcriptional regulator|nr:TetR/AcrR family transcriptional regulator [Clostridiales bacterium]
MTDEAKAAKAQAILDKAKEIFLTTDYTEIKMADIAKAMGISNGLLFVYFKTKETLFMCLLFREYEKRLDYLINAANEMSFDSFGDIKQLFMTELELLIDRNPLYIGLESMRSAILEKNTDIDILFGMKKKLFERALELAAIVCKSGILTVNQFIDIFFMESAILIGCKLSSDAPPVVAEVVNKIGIEGFNRNFKDDVLTAVSCYFDGFEASLGND